MSADEFRRKYSNNRSGGPRASIEHSIQVEYFVKLRAARVSTRWVHSNPNEVGGVYDARSAAQLKKLLAEGLTSGVADVSIPYARCGYHGAYIEFKRPKSAGRAAGTLSAEQREFREHCEREGYLHLVFDDADKALSFTVQYLSNEYKR